MRIKRAEYVKEYEIKLLFSNETTKIVDFKPLIKPERKICVPLLDLDYFKSFYVDEITICWPNELDFDPDVLYEIGKDLKDESQKIVKKNRKNIRIAAYTMTKRRSKPAKS